MRRPHYPTSWYRLQFNRNFRFSDAERLIPYLELLGISDCYASPILNHITEPFYRGDQARGAHTGGAGLGLTIAKAAMDEHRGELVATSRTGAGTTISLRFPAVG